MVSKAESEDGKWGERKGGKGKGAPKYFGVEPPLSIRVRTFEDHFGGDGGGISDGGSHGRVLGRVAVDDEVDVQHFLVVVRPLDADVVPHYQHVPLARN